MERKEQIQQLLDRLDVLQAKRPVGAVRRLLEEEASTARANIKETPTGTAIKMLARGLQNVQEDSRPDELLQKLEDAKQETQTSVDGLSSTFSEKLDALLEEVRSSEERGIQMTKSEITSMLERLAQYESDYQENIGSFSNKNASLEAEVSRLSQEIPKIYAQIPEIPDFSPSIEETKQSIQTVSKSTEDVSRALTDLEKRLVSRIAGIDTRGGNMNRNIAIGGNTSVLSRYTDINLKAGSNVTLTYAYNDTTKYTDVTLSSSGGGGGGSVTGIIRSINNISTSQPAGNTTGTDYVYIVSAGAKVTLPDATGNINLYTVKNTSTSSVMVDTTSAQTIDGSTNVILPIQFTSVDLISNGSNWDIT